MGTSLSVAFVMNTHIEMQSLQPCLTYLQHAYILYRYKYIVYKYVYIEIPNIYSFIASSIFIYVSIPKSINRFSSSVSDSDFPLSSYTYIHMNMYIYIAYMSLYMSVFLYDLAPFSFPSFWGLIRYRAVLITWWFLPELLVKACQLPIWLESSFIIIHFVGCLTNNTKPQDNKIYINLYIYIYLYI